MVQTKQKPNWAIRIAALLAVLIVVLSCQRTHPLPKWISGKWKSNFDGIDIVETWQEDGEKLIGSTVWSWDNKQRREIITLYYNSKRQLVYRMNTEHKSNLEFICQNPLEDTLVFINNKNDFPKRLVYVKPKSKKMDVWIDNEQDDPNRISFSFDKSN